MGFAFVCGRGVFRFRYTGKFPIHDDLFSFLFFTLRRRGHSLCGSSGEKPPMIRPKTTTTTTPKSKLDGMKEIQFLRHRFSGKFSSPLVAILDFILHQLFSFATSATKSRAVLFVTTYFSLKYRVILSNKDRLIE